MLLQLDKWEQLLQAASPKLQFQIGTLRSFRLCFDTTLIHHLSKVPFYAWTSHRSAVSCLNWSRARTTLWKSSQCPNNCEKAPRIVAQDHFNKHHKKVWLLEANSKEIRSGSKPLHCTFSVFHRQKHTCLDNETYKPQTDDRMEWARFDVFSLISWLILCQNISTMTQTRSGI